MTNIINRGSGRRWAYTGAFLGGLVSVAANVAHSYVPPQGAPASWTPQPGAVVGAVVWPVFLFVAVEILARVAWPHGLTWQLLRFAGITPVAFVAALVSYRHLSGLLAFYGEEPVVSHLGPLAVDGLMVMATGAILATGQPDTSTAHTTQSTVTSTAQPTTESTTSHGPTTLAPALITAPAPTTPADPPSTTTAAGGSAPRPTIPAVTTEHAAATRTEAPTPATVAERVTPSPTTIPLRSTTTRPAAAGTSKPKPKPTKTTPAQPLAAPAADTPVIEPEPAQLPLPYAVDPGIVARTREIAQQYQAENGTPITAGQLAARLRVNSDLAAQALAVVDLAANTTTTHISVNGSPVKAAR